MEGSQLFTRILPIVTLILVVVFSLALKLISRFKSRALGSLSGQSLAGFQIDAKNETQDRNRIKIKCPVLIEKSQGIMKTSLRELALSGAFLTCPNPLPIGDTFRVKIFMEERPPLKFDAEVMWNNKNVSEDKIISRGMKVRFLQLSDEDRKILNEIVVNPL
ncbi:MAG: PilZ domain-containing protein [Desulfobacterales bacterium]|nr:MAG: PilZ domain-containing protein [Desulfobacterales bacterium]